MKNALKSLAQVDVHDREAISEAFTQILQGKSTDAQIGAFLGMLRVSRQDLDPCTLADCATLVRQHALQVPFSQDPRPFVVDIVGTGGDGFDTFNASTAAAVVAAACGVCVAKHGNRASSSKSGSTDFFEALVHHPIDGISPKDMEGYLQDTKFCYLFAQTYHPALRSVAALRKELGFPTIFNLLGPLSNPILPSAAVIGVNDQQLGSVFAHVLLRLGVKRALIVHGEEGLDEISPEGKTFVWEVHGESITTCKIEPHDFGLEPIPLELVRGGSAQENADRFRLMLDSRKAVHELKHQPLVGFICMNVAALLYVADQVKTLKDGVQVALEAISSGKAKATLESFKAKLMK